LLAELARDLEEQVILSEHLAVLITVLGAMALGHGPRPDVVVEVDADGPVVYLPANRSPFAGPNVVDAWDREIWGVLDRLGWLRVTRRRERGALEIRLGERGAKVVRFNRRWWRR
jgi:hypothetical protein